MALTEKNIIVVKTGEPVPSVLQKRGQFQALIEATIGQQWQAGFASFDLRTEPAPAPEMAAAFIITGSAANIPDREPWMLRAEAWLREVVRVQIPVLGICFGHQMLAQALGGQVRRNPKGREIGTVRVERLADDILFDGAPGTFEANATHIDTVVALPPDAQVLARSHKDDHQAIRFSSVAYGVQFHPEIDRDVMRAYIDARRDILAEEGICADELSEQVQEAELAARTLRNFVRHIVPLGGR
jgi:GMP synthase (glutamine-hydrolysing)